MFGPVTAAPSGKPNALRLPSGSEAEASALSLADIDRRLLRLLLRPAVGLGRSQLADAGTLGGPFLLGLNDLLRGLLVQVRIVQIQHRGRIIRRRFRGRRRLRAFDGAFVLLIRFRRRGFCLLRIRRHVHLVLIDPQPNDRGKQKQNNYQ